MSSRKAMYSKRAGLSWIRCQLYETKLLSLFYFRAFYDDDIEEFQLASNVDKIGSFDDICFKAKVKGINKPVAVFIQTVHRENEKLKINLNLGNHFNSYKNIRQLFHPNNKDLFFKGTFDETKCVFIIYTNAKMDLNHYSVENYFYAKLNDLIDTGGTIKQHYIQNDTLEILTKQTVKDEITLLAERIAKMVTGKYDCTTQYDNLVIRYHVILAQKVFDVSEIQPPQSMDAPRHRIASFRRDFFDNNEECISLFKSQLLTDKQLTRTLLSQSTHFDGAVEMTVKEKLLSLNFKVPATFGNKDLTISCSDAKIENRMNHLTCKFKELLYNNESNKIVTIDESLGEGFLRLNGGIAGAIGNIFVLDDNTKLMKITDNWESLGPLSKKLYTKLDSEIHNLHDYKFYINVDKFPKLSFDCSGYEENLARDFLNKLVFYCNQADENYVEEILKHEITQNFQRNQPQHFQVQTDALFSKYHAEIQRWWAQGRWSLTRETDLFRSSIKNIIEDPLMSLINLTYKNKLKQYSYTFTEDAVRSLNLQFQNSSTVIVAENSILTVVKVMQHLKNRRHVVLDLENIANLSMSDQNALHSELKYTNEAKVLILVCDKIDSRNELNTLEDISKAVRYRRTVIIITNQTSLQIINRYFPKVLDILYDKKLSLIDLSKESQEIIFKTATVIFSAVEIRLDLLLNGWPMTGHRSVGTAVASGAADKETATGSH